MRSETRFVRPLIGLIAGVILFSHMAEGADVVSTLVGTGDWNDDTRWDSAFFPDNRNDGFTYDAVINSFTVTIPALVDIEIESLALTGGTIAGEGSLTLIDSSTWDGGTLSGGATGLALDGSGVTIGTAALKSFSGQVSNVRRAITDKRSRWRDLWLRYDWAASRQ